MMTKVLTLRFNPLNGAFDDQPLIDFTRDKDLIAVQNHFFTYDGSPYLAIVLDYRLGDLLNPEEPKDSRRQREDHWRETLPHNAIPFYNTLRQWRSARAKADGIPAYHIANNKQLAEMAESRPQSLTALAKLEGFGQARISKYGQEMLDLLSKVKPTSPEPSGNEPGDSKEQTSGE